MAKLPINQRSKRQRGRKGVEIRKKYLEEHPFCVKCLEEKIYTPAVEVDHIVALQNGGEDIESNKQGLCEEHHKEKTFIDKGYKKRVKIGEDGFPIEE